MSLPFQVEWLVFGAVVVAMLGIDLFVFNRKGDESHQTFRKAILWSVICIGIALLFNVFVYFDLGGTKAAEFLTAYLVEKALSVDNLFVFLMIFTYFNVPPQFQHRILFWGVTTALIMRGIFIFAGAALLAHFSWTMYLFGGFLVFTAIKLAVQKEEDMDPSKNVFLKLGRKFLRLTPEVRGAQFFVRKEGKLYATPLFLVLIVIEFTDLLFAVDSVPAVLAISSDVFIVYTSNIFAILGLRALYFVLAGMVAKFRYLRPALVVILLFIGVKMLIVNLVHLPTWLSLAVIAGVLGIAILASWLRPAPAESGH